MRRIAAMISTRFDGRGISLVPMYCAAQNRTDQSEPPVLCCSVLPVLYYECDDVLVSYSTVQYSFSASVTRHT